MASEREALPLVLIHRIPAFQLLSKHRFITKFQLLDPLDSPDPTQFLKTHAQSVRVMICVGPTPLDSGTLDCLPSLECVLGSSAGVDHIDLAECRRRGIAVTSAGESFSDDVSDYAVGLLIDVLRRVSASDRYVRAGLWPLNGEYPLGYKLGGKRVGIVGLGSIGSRVSKRLEAFGCHITYNSRTKKTSVPFPYYDNILDLATNNDILILCCGLTNETHHLIDKDIMKALGKEGVIINIGRGALVNEKDLVSFLTKGELGGAGLDVFENEPNVPTELFGLDNVVLSPHHAILTPESFDSVVELLLANLDVFFANMPLMAVVKHE